MVRNILIVLGIIVVMALVVFGNHHYYGNDNNDGGNALVVQTIPMHPGDKIIGKCIDGKVSVRKIDGQTGEISCTDMTPPRRVRKAEVTPIPQPIPAPVPMSNSESTPKPFVPSDEGAFMGMNENQTIDE